MNDWDLCKYKEDMTSGARQPGGISGTWPFMSALSLRHAYKPPEVADDLESFIYVILYMAYRFHGHNRSPNVRKDSTIEEQIKANAENERLALEVNTLFYEDDNSALGHYSGGTRKLQLILAGVPPLELHDTSSLLNRFLKQAYKLLNEHYKAVDFEALKAYAVPTVSSAKDTVPTDEERGAKRKAVPNIFGADNDDDDDTDEAPSTTTVPVPQHPTPGARRVLDDHRALYKLFKSLFKDEHGNQITRKVHTDKFVDQFNGLEAHVAVGVKAASTLKRQREEVEGAPPSPPRKMPRSGYDIQLVHPYKY